MSGLETTPSTLVKIIDTEGRVERFLRKYGMMEADELQADEPKSNSEISSFVNFRF